MATKSADMRKKYGVSKTPIPATRAFVKDMDHFQDKGIDGKSWILINDNEGTRTSVNTYDGNAGKGFKAKAIPMPADEKGVHQMLKGYTEVDVATCPVAQVVTDTKAVTA